MPASARSGAPASSRCAARCSTCSRWAPTRRCASTSSTTRSRQSARFDPQTQRSHDTLQSVRLLPAREIPLDGDAVRAFRRRWRTRFEGDPTRSPLYRGVSDGIAPPGIEFYLPLFYDGTATLFDYLPADAVVADTAELSGALTRNWEAIGTRHEDRRYDIERPLLDPRSCSSIRPRCWAASSASRRRGLALQGGDARAR
jgi:transcription-repair coupling factor (superfamily II helicase)